MVLFVFQLFFVGNWVFLGQQCNSKALTNKINIWCRDQIEKQSDAPMNLFLQEVDFLVEKKTNSQLISLSLPITFESSIVSLYQQPGGRETVNLALTLDLILLQNESCACVFPTAICSVYPRDWSEINFYQLSVSSRCVVRAQTCTSVLPICLPGLFSGIETEACVHILRKKGI